MDEQIDYQKYLRNLQTIQKSDDVEVLSQQSEKSQNSADFEKQDSIHWDQNYPHDEFVIPPKEYDSVSIDTKSYESVNMAKPKIQPVILPPLTKKLQTSTPRKFQIKNVEINQQLLKYETVQYEIESYLDESERTLVCRQYSDFEWLFEELLDYFPGIIIPSIPARAMLAKFNISNYTNSIRAQRQKGLEEFLKKVLSHPQLMDCEIIDKFLTLQDQDFRKLVSKYQQQKSAKQAIPVGKSLIVSSLGKLTGLFFSQAPDNELERYCSIVQKEIGIQKAKVKNVKDSLERTFQVKGEQGKQFQSISLLFQEICYDSGIKDSIHDDCEITGNNLRDAANQASQIVYVLEQYLLDFDVVLRVCKFRDEVQSQITAHVEALNNVKYTPEQKAIIQTQLNELQKTMSKLVENFKQDYEAFAEQFNQRFNSLAQEVQKIWTSLNQITYSTWNQK